VDADVSTDVENAAARVEGRVKCARYVNLGFFEAAR
jgi:hypothetical protein